MGNRGARQGPGAIQTSHPYRNSGSVGVLVSLRNPGVGGCFRSSACQRMSAQPMFRVKRDDTLVSTIERQYGVELNARSDMTLATLLEERGFDSLSQFLKAYHGRVNTPTRKRRLFLSFDADDKA